MWEKEKSLGAKSGGSVIHAHVVKFMEFITAIQEMQMGSFS